MYERLRYTDAEVADRITPAVRYLLWRCDNIIYALLLIKIPWQRYLDLRFPRQADPSVENIGVISLRFVLNSTRVGNSRRT